MLITRKTLGAIAVMSGLMFNTAQAEIHQPQGSAVGMLSGLQDSSQINYVNANYWLIGDDTPPTLAAIRDKVINQKLRYFVDFSLIQGQQQKAHANALLRKSLGLAFDKDFLIISEHKGELLFTPLDNKDDPNINLLDAAKEKLSRQRRSLANNRPGTVVETNSLPHVSFYLTVNKSISDSECTFPNSHLWDKGERVFCDNPNISLIYRVNLERSLQYGTTGSATPDAKIVRISLDDDTTGSGIHLNDELDYHFSKAGYVTLDAYFRDWSTDAIAQDYQFEFNASNNKAEILKTFPRENLNSEFQVRDVSGFTLGVSGSLEGSSDGPKGKLEASASYNQSRWITFNTYDYRVERSTKNPQNIRFKWDRDQYKTAESLLSKWTNPLWNEDYPLDTQLINSIGYASFVPKMDIIYKAAPDETGTTEFTIDSSVNIRPIYNGAYKHYYVVGGHQSYHGFENGVRRRVSKSANFTVDWEHPVFTGGRPVNLQLGSFNNRCVEVGNDNTVSTSECDETKTSQSFIFDQLGRYVSAINVNKCLDGNSLEQLKTCNSNLSQRWEWEKDSDRLTNIFSHQQLGHNKTTGELGLFSGEDDQVSLRTITSYTNVFSIFEESPVFGYTTGTLALQDVGKNGTLYIRHGNAIDAIGTQENAMHGGNSGSLTQIDLNRVVKVSVTSGEFQYGGKHLLNMVFTMYDGSTQTVGSTTAAITTSEETFEVPDGASIQQIKVWSNGWIADGIQFILN
ncbi:leukocidin family pore-forming toxin [Vibrio caribbeanicus]|nr:leukocidin family pore-forming toxin [Vibrio caribbeanicus]MCY9843143.1 leukocidin family pore-forming toxin [Vibrio caribbeanicus]